MKTPDWWLSQRRRLALRGVSKSIIDQLHMAGDEKLVLSLLNTPREQIARLNDLDERTRNHADEETADG